MDENKIIAILKILIIKNSVTIFEIFNEFHRENIIQRNLNNLNNQNNNVPKVFLDKINIYENDEIDEIKFFIENYKIKFSLCSNLSNNYGNYSNQNNSNNEIQNSLAEQNNFPIENKNPKNTIAYNLNKERNRQLNNECIFEMEEEFNYKNLSEKRRKIKKNMDAYLNYLPILCKDHICENSDNVILSNDNCIYAHNDNEIFFHVLNYKTELCSKKNCENNLCPNSHNLGNDFRIIYDYKKKDIINLILKVEKNHLLKDKLKSFISYYKNPENFSLDTFKILPCRLGLLCGKDRHLCYNYHEKNEKRRPPCLFNVKNVICPDAQPGTNSDFYPHLCQNVIKYIFFSIKFTFFYSKLKFIKFREIIVIKFILNLNYCIIMIISEKSSFVVELK